MLVSIIEYFIHCLFRFYVISLTCFYSLFGRKMKSITIILTLLLFFGCSTKKTDKELFDEAKKNPYLYLEMPKSGGHVGFVGGSVWHPVYWAEQRAARFLAEQILEPR